MKILALAGGVGGAKLAFGLARILPPGRLTIAVNTGDDFTHLGLRICPDLDTVTYTLAGIANTATGWGIEGETWNTMSALETVGGPTWFRLGDKDIATHLQRTQQLADGKTLSEVTASLTKKLGIRHAIVPASDEPISTIVQTPDGDLPFQEYFVKRQCEPTVRGFEFSGAAAAKPAPSLQGAFDSNAFDAVVICPSNPFVSIAPIMAVPGIRKFIDTADIPVVAVSPIVGGKALKGPAGKMLNELGIEPSSAAIARQYRDIATTLVIDTRDAGDRDEIERLGMQDLIADTVMQSDEDRISLARDVLAHLGAPHG